jgi:enamine deaminase RidA (YjgF/YER057c/UK114 family)
VRTRPGFPVGLEETVCGQPDLQWGFQAACRILRHTCSDVSGMSRSTMPRGVPPPRTTVGTSGLLVDGCRIEIDLIGAVG